MAQTINVNPAKTDKISRVEGVVLFDTDNLYPQRTRNLITRSSTAKRVTSEFARFIYGKGMQTEGGFWKKAINARGLRVDQFMRRIIDMYCMHGGFSFHVRYNALGEAVSYTPIDFELCRIGKPDDEDYIGKIVVYDKWEKGYRRLTKKGTIYDVYNPDPEIVLRQIELAGGIEDYEGQIFYYGQNGEVEYPLMPLESVRDDMTAEILISRGKNSNAGTNFLASQIFVLPGTYKELSPYPEDKEDDVEVTRFETEITEMMRSMQGASRMGSVAILENNMMDKDGKPIDFKVVPFTVQNFDRIHEYTEGSCKNAIIKASGVPQILIEPTATGFSTEIMASYYEYYNEVTSYERQIFEEVATSLFKTFRGKTDFNPSGDFSITPLKIQINAQPNY